MMKREIREVVGVPTGILQSAEQLYKNLLNAFEDTNDMEFVFRGTFKEEFSFPTKFKINDLDITSVDVLVNYNVVENDKLELAGAGYMGELGVNYRRFMVIFMNEPNEVNLSMDFLIPNNREVVFEELIEYMYENMTQEQQVLVNHVADLERKIASTAFNLDQLNVGKNAFLQMLKNSLVAAKAIAEANATEAPATE